MTTENAVPANYPAAIEASGLTIYDLVPTGGENLRIPDAELEQLLDDGLHGFSVEGLALRTRSKCVKEQICAVLGYPAPRSFRRISPSFPGQGFDVYVQKSDNLQVWNRHISDDLRYVLVRVGADDKVSKVRVVTGDVLSGLDATGTLTQKYQARLELGNCPAELIVPHDTDRLRPLVCDDVPDLGTSGPSSPPATGRLLSIQALFDLLSPLVGREFGDVGRDQERNRGSVLHRAVCEALGYNDYHDHGQFPDVLNQLLEVKLQTSPTIDLGKVSPDSTAALDAVRVGGVRVRHCDVRYAVFHATTDGERVSVTNLMVVNGENFYSRFPQFGGNVVNSKIQLRLPTGFFDG